MAAFRVGPGVLLLLTLLLGAAAWADDPPAVLSQLYDRPVLVVDPGMHTAIIKRAAADRDGRWAVTGSDDKTVRIWSLADGALLRTIRLPAGPGNVGKVFAVAMSPDGALVAAGGWTRFTEADPVEQIYLFDRATGALVRRIEGLPNVVNHLAFSPDGGRLAAVLGRGGLRVYARERNWDEVARDEDYGDASYGADFAPDGRLATVSDDGRVRLYSRDLNGQIRPSTTITPIGDPQSITFSPDGSRLAVGYFDSIKVDILDGRTLAPLKRPDVGGIRNGDLFTATWSRDGRTLFAGGRYDNRSGSPVLAWGAAGAGGRHSLPAGQQTVMSIVPLPGGDLLVASADPWLARLTSNGTPRWVHGPPKADFRNQFDRLSVAEDGSRVDFGFEQYARSPARFDVAKRTLLLAPGEDPAMSLPRQMGLPVEHWFDEFHPTLDGKPLPLEPYERARTLAVSLDAGRFVLGTEWALRAFDSHGTPLWRRAVPGVVWAVNISGDGRLVVAAYQDGTIRWHRLSDGAELLAFMPLPNKRDWVMWTPEGFYSASEGAKGVLQWHVNQGWNPARSVPVESIPGYERSTLPGFVLRELETPRALGLAEIEQARQVAVAKLSSPMAPGPHLHLLAIGVKDYNEANAKRLQLGFADRDAHDLRDKIVATQSGFYTVDSDELLNDDANKPGIMEALARMRRGMEQGSGNDIAVVFFSGHGTVEDGELYLLPYEVDARSVARLKATALSITDLKRELVALASHGRVLVLLDACHSGASTEDGEPLAMDSTALRSELAAANITVLTSSSGREVSREDPAWSHGAFTKVLIEAFGDPAADINHDHFINANGLANYVSTRVAALTGNAQNPGMEVRFNSTVFAAAAR